MASRQADNERFIARFIDGSPGAMYDIGVGPKTEWRTLTELYPRMRLCGCEPNPAMYEKLLRLKFPGLLAKVAIAEEDGERELHVDPKALNSSFFPTAAAKTKVKCWTLDRFDEEMGQPDRVLLWMDIEGSELAALRGGPKLLSSGRVRWINLEERRHDRHLLVDGWADPHEIRKLLEGYGYRRVRAYNVHPTHQDAIYAL